MPNRRTSVALRRLHGLTSRWANPDANRPPSRPFCEARRFPLVTSDSVKTSPTLFLLLLGAPPALLLLQLLVEALNPEEVLGQFLADLLVGEPVQLLAVLVAVVHLGWRCSLKGSANTLIESITSSKCLFDG